MSSIVSSIAPWSTVAAISSIAVASTASASAAGRLLGRPGSVFHIAADDSAQGIFPGRQVSVNGNGLIAIFIIIKIGWLFLAAILGISAAHSI
jgi:hypothetical protein